MNDCGVVFNYEKDKINTGYYYVYARNGHLDDECVWPEMSITLAVPETDANTDDIIAIRDAMNRIASRMQR